MSTVTKKVSINAPVKKVYEFVTDPGNWTKYVSSLIDIRDISSPGVEKGTTFKWTYRMMGMNFHGVGQVTENVKNKKFGMSMQGSFPIHEMYTFLPTEEGTELSVEIQYEVPGKIMSVVANKSLMEKMNKKEADTVLSKIKILCEEL